DPEPRGRQRHRRERLRGRLRHRQVARNEEAMRTWSKRTWSNTAARAALICGAIGSVLVACGGAQPTPVTAKWASGELVYVDVAGADISSVDAVPNVLDGM